MRPRRSFLDPTWYQTFTATIGQFAILVDDHVEAVGQRAAREGDLHHWVAESLRVLLPQVAMALP